MNFQKNTNISQNDNIKSPQQKMQNNDYSDFFSFLNQKNNMNLIKIILFYSKYSKLCDDFLTALHPYYKQIITFICVDNSKIRKRLMTSKYKLQVVPSIFMLFENGVVNVHSGQELIQLVDFFNKNMETFMVVKSQSQKQQPNSIQSPNSLQTQSRLIQDENNKNSLAPKVTALNFNIRKEKNNQANNSSDENELESRQTLLMRENQELSRINNGKNPKNIKLTGKEITHLPRVKDPIPYEFNKKTEIGMSSKRLVPKGKKEHEKMALTSVKFIEGNRLDPVEEEDDDDDDDDNEIDINIEDAEILDDDIDELINSEDDPTIDPIIKKDSKKSIKEIAADMQQVRGDPDSKKIQ
jgi:hypothetical protein